MNVKNRKCIRHLSFKALLGSRKRNLIAVFAIALTTLLFTSLFTIVMSLNSSYETYNFRQVGGYCHGTFKDVTEEQIAAISAHSNVTATGARTTIGFSDTGVFAKVPAEISYMDENCTKWSYAVPTTGRTPKTGKEIAMDTRALELLGISPELGAKISLTYTVGDKNQTSFEETDTFTLVGYWEYDDLMPVHYLNISEEYAKEIEVKGIAYGMQPFRTDLNVMMRSSIDIRGQMEQVDLDLGYDWETFDEENSVRIGVNWGYTSSELNANMDPGTAAAIIAFLLLVIFTGYLIIYNIFQISVTGDIRFYGLLKTIGVTPRQLKRIIRWQALMLCVLGIPIGIAGGYCVGAVLTPYVLSSTSLGTVSATISTSPFIFLGAALFSLGTVLLSCSRPGRMAAKVSPVEAAKYTETHQTKKKRRATRGAKVYQMAFANLGRSRQKTGLVVLSLSLAVVLLNVLYTFVGGFDMEKYLSKQTCADFIVSSTDYFRFSHNVEEYLSEETVSEIEEQVTSTIAGSGYCLYGERPEIWMPLETWKTKMRSFISEEMMEQTLSMTERRGDLVAAASLIEGLDASLFEKLTVVEGDLSPLFEKDSHTIALCADTDDYGNITDRASYPAVGDTITVTYITDAWFIDSRTGEPCDDSTPEEFLEYHVESSRDMDYRICALVTMPYSMSFRYRTRGYDAVLPVETLKKDSGMDPVRMFYLFDTPDQAAESAAESYLADLTAGDLSPLMYESKATIRADFEGFRNMFLLLGGLLCAIIGLVGVLNFFNAMMTSILSRRREFAVLQAIGQTQKQMKSMLICEGLFYALGAALLSLLFSLVMTPLVGKLLESMFWFYTCHFTLLPVLSASTAFLLLGVLIPFALYPSASKESIVESLRETA